MQEVEDKQALCIKCAEGAFLEGKASARLLGAGGSFTPCTVAGSLLEAVTEAARNATSSDVVLLSPVRSSWDEFRDQQHRGEVLCQAVKSIGRGVRGGTPNIDGKKVNRRQHIREAKRTAYEFCFGVF